MINNERQQVELYAQAVMGKMTHMIFHELNNYLSPLAGRAQLIKMFSNDPKIQTNIDIMIDVTNQMTRYIQSLQRVFSNNKSMKVQLADFFRQATELVVYRFRKRNIQFDLSLGDDLPLLDLDYRNWNLFTICLLKSSEESLSAVNGGHIRLCVDVVEDQLTIQVQDDGPLFPEELLLNPSLLLEKTWAEEPRLQQDFQFVYYYVMALSGDFQLRNQEKGIEISMKIPIQNLAGNYDY